MKKIINGKKYDTETAIKLGDWDNGLGRNDFHFAEEELFRKRTGEFFLYGCGGAMSKYRYTYPNGNQWCGSETIIPYSYEEARAWAEEKLDADEYEKLFGEVEEDDSQVQTCISIKKKCFDDIKLNSAAYGITASRFIERCCDIALSAPDMLDKYEDAIRKAYDVADFPFSFRTFCNDYASDYISIHKCRNGREAVWYLDADGHEGCVYVGDCTVLDGDEIEEQLQ